ncbi:DUF1194 domain-containing protein [Shimia sediminis]|uniref:DUF1194 domain-containing protein n=1 Tax=Shimia sediminis TaxID=2497945 RepID=UPI001F3BF298|nr:DUF1194 domain-containing protein [Shimia sediminis]
MIRALALWAALWAMPAGATECRLALALALDVSSSVDALEDKFQRRGLANALISAEVERAFFLSPQPVALAVFEWSGAHHQHVLLDWRLIETPNDLYDVSARLGGSARTRDDEATALGQALAFAAQLFARAPDCLGNTLDISGDGMNNDGFGPHLAYRNFPLGGITVNGLAIRSLGFSTGAFTAAPVDIRGYFEREVIRGPNAFVEVAANYGDYERAMRRKLERELAPLIVTRLQAEP